MKWEKGRQNTGYEKLKIFQLLNIDCYILRYKEGDFIPTHKDPVPGRNHWRFNFVLKNAIKGGVFQYYDHSRNLWINPGRFVKFRPDISEHRVTTIREGSRIVLTFGIAI